jgi:cullin-5
VLLTLNFIYCQDFLYFTFFLVFFPVADSVNIKILNAGAWSRSSEKVFVSLPTELEDLIPEVEEFYKKNHSGRKLHWHHLMSNGIVSS